MKKILSFLVLLCSITVFSQNLVDTSEWVAGTNGATTNFSLQGTASQNSRISMLGPYGSQVTVWQAQADGSSGFNGGFQYKGLVVDTNKTYRVTFWMRSNGANNCTNYNGFVPYYTGGGLVQPFLNENGGSVSWPYFSSTNLPNDKWFLVVGYLRPNSATDLGVSGVYDPSLGSATNLPAPSFTTTDFIFPSTESQINLHIRTFMWACGAGEKMFIYDPRVEEVSAQISLSQLLYNSSTTTPTTTTPVASAIWTQNGSDISYSSGNVGIGTSNPGAWKLAVNGNIRAKEIKVETGWADYVFEDNYSLPTLEEVESHIKEKGHLINIPSAKEVEENGIQLGEMNKLLLEKIEELTLYIIQQEKRIKLLEEK